MSRLKDPEGVRKIARKPLFEGLDRMCEGAIVVDRKARVVDERGRVIGAAGFMLFDRLQYLQPLVSKFQRLETQLADIQTAAPLETGPCAPPVRRVSFGQSKRCRGAAFAGLHFWGRGSCVFGT